MQQQGPEIIQLYLCHTARWDTPNTVTMPKSVLHRSSRLLGAQIVLCAHRDDPNISQTKLGISPRLV